MNQERGARVGNADPGGCPGADKASPFRIGDSVLRLEAKVELNYQERRGPVFSRQCSLSFPSAVLPLTLVIGLGTIKGKAESRPLHIALRRVAKLYWLSPTHSNGLPGKRTSIISSVNGPGAGPSKRTGDSSLRSYSPQPWRTKASILFLSRADQAG